MTPHDGTPLPELVIKKRRKRPRQAIDPCLGFYRPHTPVPAVNVPASKTISSSEPTGNSGMASGLAAQKAEISRTPGSMHRGGISGFREHKQVTVEDFLRWSVEEVRGSRQSTRISKKRKFVSLNEVVRSASKNASDHQAEVCPRPKQRRVPIRRVPFDSSSPAPGSEDDSSYTPHITKKPARRKFKSKKPLADRIYAAAVLSHVDVEVPNQNMTTHTGTQKPLKFQAFHISPPSTPKSKKQKWRVVDPATFSVAPAYTTFSKRPLGPPPPPSPPRMLSRMTRWLPDVYQTPTPKPAFNTMSSRDTRIGTLPLTFVPSNEDPVPRSRESIKLTRRPNSTVAARNTNVGSSPRLNRLLFQNKPSLLPVSANQPSSDPIISCSSSSPFILPMSTPPLPPPVIEQPAEDAAMDEDPSSRCSPMSTGLTELNDYGRVLCPNSSLDQDTEPRLRHETSECLHDVDNPLVAGGGGPLSISIDLVDTSAKPAKPLSSMLESLRQITWKASQDQVRQSRRSRKPMLHS